jgi:hypothetical protein
LFAANCTNSIVSSQAILVAKSGIKLETSRASWIRGYTNFNILSAGLANSIIKSKFIAIYWEGFANAAGRWTVSGFAFWVVHV